MTVFLPRRAGLLSWGSPVFILAQRHFILFRITILDIELCRTKHIYKTFRLSFIL